jgi:transposase
MLTNNQLQKTLDELDWLVKVYKKNHPTLERDWRTYEQQVAYRVKQAIAWFEPMVDKAVNTLKIYNANGAGRKPELSLKQKVILLLTKHLFGKSNREMAGMLAMFSLLTDMDVSYKTIERLYSDEPVQLVLHNLHMLILQEKGIKESDASGDGTGYGLIVKKHYASEVEKHKDKAKDVDQLAKASKQQKNKGKRQKKRKSFVYSFRLIDPKTRMYIAYGTSFKSEKEAYNRGMQMAQQTGIKLKSIRLDKYYSNQKDAKKLDSMFKGITLYLIPKSNATIRGDSAWKRTLSEFTKNTLSFLEQYYQRNQSESGFGEDKKRFGQQIAQRLEERVDTANSLTTLWHNLLWLEG